VVVEPVLDNQRAGYNGDEAGYEADSDLPAAQGPRTSADQEHSAIAEVRLACGLPEAAGRVDMAAVACSSAIGVFCNRLVDPHLVIHPQCILWPLCCK
jgi:hypothetical protein